MDSMDIHNVKSITSRIQKIEFYQGRFVWVKNTYIEQTDGKKVVLSLYSDKKENLE